MARLSRLWVGCTVARFVQDRKSRSDAGQILPVLDPDAKALKAPTTLQIDDN